MQIRKRVHNIIVLHLRMFAWTSGSAREWVGVNHVIQSILMLLRLQLRLVGIDITTDLAAEDKVALGNSIRAAHHQFATERPGCGRTSTPANTNVLGTAMRDGHVERTHQGALTDRQIFIDSAFRFWY